MSFGIQVFDSSGLEMMSNDMFSVALLGIIEVLPTDTDSFTFTDVASFNIVLTQTQVEPTTIDEDTLSSLNVMTVTSTVVGDDVRIDWSPRFSQGDPLNVLIYVMGY